MEIEYSRRKILKRKGILDFEADVLQTFDLSIPYVKNIIEDRQAARARAKAAGKTRKQYQTSIVRRYAGKRWSNQGRPARSIEAVYAMIRSFEDRYKQDNHDYQSGGENRRKTYKEHDNRWNSYIDGGK